MAVRGPQAWSIARSLFQPRSKSTVLPDEPQPGQFWLGRFGADVADDVVLNVGWVESSRPIDQPEAQAPSQPSVGLEDSTHSMKASWIEIHCHGGREIVGMLLEILESCGAHVCTWQELRRLSDDDPLHAEAVIALADAKTTRTAAILLDQVHGAFRRALDAVLQSNDATVAERQLAAIDRYSALGRHLGKPWQVVIAGAPNVGKSSLANALSGFQRSIVAPTPGTTRDVVTSLTAFDGWPVELADTAGLRGEADDLEAEGIGLALESARAADLCVWVLDGSVSPIWADSHLSSVLLVINKIDLPPVWDHESKKDAVSVSALTGAGIAGLADAIARRLVPDPPPPGAAVPFTERLQNGIAEALALCRAGQLTEAINIVRSLRQKSAPKSPN
jgi:tRNA modification GTPase